MWPLLWCNWCMGTILEIEKQYNFESNFCLSCVLISLHCSEIDGLSLSFCPRDLTYLIQSHFACRWQCHKFFSKAALASKWGRFVDLEKCPLNLYKKRFHCNDGIQTTNLLHHRQACYHWAIRPLTTASVLQVII